MDQTTQVNPMPPAPIFGVAPGGDGGGGGMGVGGSSKFINIDEIFADCFMDGDSDLLSFGGTGSQEGGVEGGQGGGGGGGGGVGGRAGGDQLSSNPNAAISSSGGGLHAATFGMGTPAMMQTQQQQQQQQQLSASPLDGMSMFLDRSPSGGDLAGGVAGGDPVSRQGLVGPGRGGIGGGGAASLASNPQASAAPVVAAAKAKVKGKATTAAAAAAAGTAAAGTAAANT
ncbi:unnamed protein product, partial [Pylaiella littoralis]